MRYNSSCYVSLILFHDIPLEFILGIALTNSHIQDIRVSYFEDTFCSSSENDAVLNELTNMPNKTHIKGKRDHDTLVQTISANHGVILDTPTDSNYKPIASFLFSK